MKRKELCNLILNDEITSQKILGKLLDENQLQSCCAFFDAKGNFLARGVDTSCEKLVLQVIQKMSNKKISDLISEPITN